MIDLEQHLDDASLPERVVPICLRGDLTGALKDAQADLDAVRGGFDPDQQQKAEERVTAAREAAEKAALPFRLRGVHRLDWERLVTEHPAREGDEVDRMLGYNRDAFYQALLRECLIDPQPTDQQWRRLVGDRDTDTKPLLTFPQYDRLITAAMDLSRHEEALVPFSSSGSELSRARSKKSARPANSD